MFLILLVLISIQPNTLIPDYIYVKILNCKEPFTKFAMQDPLENKEAQSIANAL